MKAVLYEAPYKFKITDVPVPSMGDDDILLKVTCCGVCGTDTHIHEGDFTLKFPLIPGHETIGTVVDFGKNVKGFSKGDRVVSDVGVPCELCFFCRKGKFLLCENYQSNGSTLDGGFSEYIAYKQNKCYKISHLSDEEAIMVEPTACVIHGLDRLRPPVGAEALILGSGPTGIIMAQLLKLNGASKVSIIAFKGMKMDYAKKVGAGDEYFEVDSADPAVTWRHLREQNKYGFDVVIEATGAEQLANEAINYVRRGGTLLIYGVYEHKARVHWSPSRIFLDEIRIIGSFSSYDCFPRAVAYLESGKVNVKGMVTNVFTLDEYQDALDKMKSQNCVKVVIKP